MTNFVARVEGVSGHISRIELDRDVYAVGETATVTANILTDRTTESADLAVTATLRDGTRSACAPPVVQPFGGGMETIHISVQERCVDPQVELQIAAQDGTVLDHDSLGMTSQQRPFSSLKAFVSLFIGMFLLAVLTVYLIVRQLRTTRPRNAALALVFMIACGGLMSAHTASASTWGGSVWLDTDNWDWVGTGTGITMHLGCGSCVRGSLSVTSGPIRVNGGVSMPTDNFRINGNGNRIDFYTGNSFNFAGFLSVSGGTVAGSATCNTDGWSITGSGNNIIVSCSGG
jgi:hypothetical protein